ncbi:hypothetical protein M2418_000346 [Rhizobium sp. BIGb0125]|uniref:hypothetical protein n=1 Tax=Rhizobium sp. BIGb0125 TaxID=2940618 RepID=UPI002168F255|nr:hypothetical protein [Rhizobium sp. BIGb0125]MCS4240844.1 hypothetical protein [Rhizobium sp. BIGb0125]
MTKITSARQTNHFHRENDKKIPKWVQARAFDEGACLKIVISTAFARKRIYRFASK